MKVTLEFDGEEGGDEIQVALDGYKWKNAMWELDQELRKVTKNYMMLKDGYKPKDSIVESVISQFKKRSDVGIAKYGVTLDRTDLSTLDWLNHAQQEAMDFCLYLEKLKQEFTGSEFGLKEIKEKW